MTRLRAAELLVVIAHVFVACFGVGCALGKTLDFEPLLSVPVAGIVNFFVLVMFRREVRQATSDAADVFDEARLLGFVVPAVIPLFRPLVELGLVQSAARIASRGQRTKVRAIVICVTWLRVAVDVALWIAISRGAASIAALLACGSVFLLAVALRCVTQPSHEKQRVRTSSSSREEPVAFGAVDMRGLANA